MDSAYSLSSFVSVCTSFLLIDFETRIDMFLNWQDAEIKNQDLYFNIDVEFKSGGLLGLVPFYEFCKQEAEGVWAVVDISL
jgi:hypothetical protein